MQRDQGPGDGQGYKQHRRDHQTDSRSIPASCVARVLCVVCVVSCGVCGSLTAKHALLGVRTGKLYNCTDANSLVSFDPQTLKTSGKEERYAKFNPDIKGPLSAAHGQYDATRGEYVRNYDTSSHVPLLAHSPHTRHTVQLCGRHRSDGGLHSVRGA